MRRKSVSPYGSFKKEPSSNVPNKNLIKTLYNSEWRKEEKSETEKEKVSSSTIYGKFLAGLKEKEKKNEKYFKKKNTKEIDHVLKYEQKINSKYLKFDHPTIKIEGFGDRLFERKALKTKK